MCNLTGEAISVLREAIELRARVAELERKLNANKSRYFIPAGCICQGDGLMGMKCEAKEHAMLWSDKVAEQAAIIQAVRMAYDCNREETAHWFQKAGEQAATIAKMTEVVLAVEWCASSAGECPVCHGVSWGDRRGHGASCDIGIALNKQVHP
jgi:hypothetical protein